MAEGVEDLDTHLSWVETNVNSVTDLLHEFVSSVHELRGAFAVAGIAMQPAGHEPEVTSESLAIPPGGVEPTGREPEVTSELSAIPPGGVEPAGREPEAMSPSSDIPPGGVEPTGHEPEVISGSSDIPPGDEQEDASDDDVIIRKKATGPSAVPLSPRRPNKSPRKPSSPLTTSFFSGKETEEEVPLSKVLTPKKLRPFTNMAMPPKPPAGMDGLWCCSICNISTFRSHMAFHRHWNLHRRECRLQCHVCDKVLSDRRNFRQHMKNMHGIQAKDVESGDEVKQVEKPHYPCHVTGCTTICSSKDSHTTHEKRHSETVADKTCSYCGRVYKWKVDAVGYKKVCKDNPNHLRKVCKFPGCGVQVSTSGNLRKHESSCLKGKHLQTEGARSKEAAKLRHMKEKDKKEMQKKRRDDQHQKPSAKIRRSILPRRR